MQQMCFSAKLAMLTSCGPFFSQTSPQSCSQVLLACGERQRQCLDLKLMTQRSIATAADAPLISYSKYAEFLDEACQPKWVSGSCFFPAIERKAKRKTVSGFLKQDTRRSCLAQRS